MSDHLYAAREYAEAIDQPDMSDADALAMWADNLVDDHCDGGEHIDSLAEIADDLEAMGATEDAARFREIIPTLG
ncbi:MAG TPA: hypothetical protein VMW08_00075 [Acidimicrobiales bacterium]|nr:hypothetical protein [Acidimicrobiales bacterium]